MSEGKTVGFIGAGNMASAIIGGLLKSSSNDGKIYIYDIDVNKTIFFADKGIIVSNNIGELCSVSDIIFLCVKPQNFDEVLSQLKEDNNKIFVTIAAGISTGSVQKYTGNSSKVIRVMPNTPLLLGAGASALSRTDTVSNKEFDFVISIFRTLGIAEELPENLMNAVISVNGSSPAFVFMLADALARGAAEQGIDKKTALKLISQTIIGSGRMLLETGKTPEELIEMVASPGGTTIAALEVLNNNEFTDVVVKAMKACTKRADELGESNN